MNFAGIIAKSPPNDAALHSMLGANLPNILRVLRNVIFANAIAKPHRLSRKSLSSGRRAVLLPGCLATDFLWSCLINYVKPDFGKTRIFVTFYNRDSIDDPYLPVFRVDALIF